jgi:endonuclease G
MDSKTAERLQQLFRQRLTKQAPEIEHSLRQIAAGNPLGAEPDKERGIKRLSAKAGIPTRDASALLASVRRTAVAIDAGATADGAESMQGPTMDFVGVEFLSRGRLAANAVGRVSFKTGFPQGSGFLVGPGLFLTNNHVIPTREAAAQMVVEFDYESSSDGVASPITTFSFDPDKCFVFDPIDGLDFTLIALGTRLQGSKGLPFFGFIVLSDANDKHMLGEIANIIQHPQGGYKQLVVRENSIISRDETNAVLHYLADTEKGSSGSPVCNNDWEPIALHHWGEPHLELKNSFGAPLRQDVNEGIRISAIVTALKAHAGAGSDAKNAEAVSRLLQVWGAAPRGGPIAPKETATNVAAETSPAIASNESADPIGRPAISQNGTVTWTLPLEFSLKLPFGAPARHANTPAVPPSPPAPTPSPAPASGSEKLTSSKPDFSDRNGYEPGFIQGFVVALPDWSNVPFRVAKNQLAVHGDAPEELRYHHFSIVMNADRRVALFTACNIDGKRLVAVNRADKTTNMNPTLKDLGAESASAEASDDFRRDPRILDSEQMLVDFYKNQVVPGYAKPNFPGKDADPEVKKAYTKAMNERTARMFQKGHITLRGDPAWGTSDQALLAEADTFYYTNAAPQLGYFNQGSPVKSPAAKGKLRWRAVETFILRNAITMRQRVIVFAGPVCADDDPDYRFDSKVPMQFWKIAVWKGEGRIQSVAVLANQRPVLEKLTKGMPEGREAYDDDEELSRVTELVSTVAKIEELTGLRFDDHVRDGDIRRGEDSAEAMWDFKLLSQSDGKLS